MMRTLSIEWARFNIKLIAMAAGQFATETLLTKYPQPSRRERSPDSIPLGRLGRSEEIAWLVAYLASPAGDFFSGTTITIDGARDNWHGPWPPASDRRAGAATCRGVAPRPSRSGGARASAARAGRAGSRGRSRAR